MYSSIDRKIMRGLLFVLSVVVTVSEPAAFFDAKTVRRNKILHVRESAALNTLAYRMRTH